MCFSVLAIFAAERCGSLSGLDRCNKHGNQEEQK